MEEPTMRAATFLVAGSLAVGALVALLGFGAIPAVGQTTGSATTADSDAAKVPDDTVQKAGVAMHHVIQIRQSYSQREQAASMPSEKQDLLQQAETATVKAVTDQGLSVQEYDRVLHLAMADPNLKARLLKVETTAR
jgi:hypothetical protein